MQYDNFIPYNRGPIATAQLHSMQNGNTYRNFRKEGEESVNIMEEESLPIEEESLPNEEESRRGLYIKGLLQGRVSLDVEWLQHNMSFPLQLNRKKVF